jgi:hypothetical protein
MLKMSMDEFNEVRFAGAAGTMKKDMLFRE